MVLLSALVIVADWIASSDLFDAAELGAQPSQTTAERGERAWRELDFPRPWEAAPSVTDAATLLTSRFALPAGATPHATQTAFVDMALTIERPELMILESEMGSGKTEAALLAAEILASRFGLSGIFVGLPTQATADGMFSRILDWAERLELEVPASVFLARGRAMLNLEYAQKSREAYFRSMGDEHRAGREASDSTVIAHRWFADPRRGPLSNFVVGTVDQALFAGLRSRYVMLRHLALASKVVVIDEVHAYDVYMRQYLDETLEVVVLQRDQGGAFFLPDWVPGGGKQIPANERPNGALTRDILGCMIRLPPGMCQGNALDRHIATLERAFDLPFWHGSHALKGEIVLAFDMARRARLNEFDLSYSPEDGLRYERRDG